MSSAALAVTLTQTIPLWIGVKKGLSIEKVLEGLPKDSENRSACQSVLYTAVRQRALLQKLSSDLISRAPADDVLALIELALGLLSEGKEKPFTVVNEAVAAAKHSRKMVKAANFVNAILRRFGREKTELLVPKSSRRFVSTHPIGGFAATKRCLVSKRLKFLRSSKSIRR